MHNDVGTISQDENIVEGMFISKFQERLLSWNHFIIRISKMRFLRRLFR